MRLFVILVSFLLCSCKYDIEETYVSYVESEIIFGNSYNTFYPDEYELRSLAKNFALLYLVNQERAKHLAQKCELHKIMPNLQIRDFLNLSAFYKSSGYSVHIVEVDNWLDLCRLVNAKGNVVRSIYVEKGKGSFFVDPTKYQSFCNLIIEDLWAGSSS